MAVASSSRWMRSLPRCTLRSRSLTRSVPHSERASGSLVCRRRAQRAPTVRALVWSSLGALAGKGGTCQKLHEVILVPVFIPDILRERLVHRSAICGGHDGARSEPDGEGGVSWRPLRRGVAVHKKCGPRTVVQLLVVLAKIAARVFEQVVPAVRARMSRVRRSGWLAAGERLTQAAGGWRARGSAARGRGGAVAQARFERTATSPRRETCRCGRHRTLCISRCACPAPRRAPDPSTGRAACAHPPCHLWPYLQASARARVCPVCLVRRALRREGLSRVREQETESAPTRPDLPARVRT